MRWMLLLFMSLSLPVLADLDYSLKPRQIAEDTWLLEGSTDNFAKANGGNIVNTAFIVTEPGVVVIDTGPSKRYGEAMRKAIAAITDKPVIQVLLTHHHPDHVLGNQAFTDVPIGALAGTTGLLRQQGDAMAENMYRLVGDWMRGTEVVLPTRTLTPGVQSFGNHDLHLLSLGGHTGADLVILDRKTGVLFAGDLVFYQRALTTPNSPGLAVWLSDIATLQGLPWTLIGPIPERFTGISLSRYELIRSVSHLYPRYERTQMTRVDSTANK